MTFNAKNLSYEANEPAFLRRLRGEHGSANSARHERPLARPRMQMKDGEEDDQPTYVVEDSQDTLSKTEYEALRRQNEDEKTGETDPPFSEKDDNSNESTADATKEKDLSTDKVASAKEQVAAIGASNKRRLAKIVGERDEEMTRPEQEDSKQQAKRPEAKKAKKVKLTFDEDTIEAL